MMNGESIFDTEESALREESRPFTYWPNKRLYRVKLLELERAWEE